MCLVKSTSDHIKIYMERWLAQYKWMAMGQGFSEDLIEDVMLGCDGEERTLKIMHFANLMEELGKIKNVSQRISFVADNFSKSRHLHGVPDPIPFAEMIARGGEDWKTRS